MVCLGSFFPFLLEQGGRSSIVRGRWLAKMYPFAVVTFLVIATSRTAYYLGARQPLSASQSNHPSEHDENAVKNSSLSLGVRMLAPVYAIISETQDGRKNVTVALTIWLKRVGAQRGPYDLAHQAQDSVRMLVWADSPLDLHNRQWGHLKLPVDHATWIPKLLLETVEPGPVLRATYEPQAEQQRSVNDQIIRPYSFRVDLPSHLLSDCFKVIEASYPMHKASVCLPPAKFDPTCDLLAPPGRYNTTHPALYSTIGSVRHTYSTRNWPGYQAEVAARIWNYVTYHVEAGTTGLLLYADELQRSYMTQNPLMLNLIRRGQLRLVEWNMHERGHKDDDGRGRPLGYNYDQALFASHVNLGLSSCGANIWVVVTDIDEYLYIPKPSRRWPEPLLTCMDSSTAGPGPAITMHLLQRFEILTSTISHEDERKLWITPGTLGNTTADSRSNSHGGTESGHHNGSSSYRGRRRMVHPLALYDQVYTKPLSRMHGKIIVQPAARPVLFFVHEAVPLYGKTKLVHHHCLVLLHVVNFHGSRRTPGGAEVHPFQHWLFEGRDVNKMAAWE